MNNSHQVVNLEMKKNTIKKIVDDLVVYDTEQKCLKMLGVTICCGA